MKKILALSLALATVVLFGCHHEEAETPPVESVADAQIPKNCMSWFDGCNVCKVGESGEPMACTKMVCSPVATQQSYCRAKQIEKSEDWGTVDVKYPLTGNSTVDAAIENLIDSTISNYETTAKEMTAEMATEEIPTAGKNDLTITYKTFNFSPEVWSVAFEIYEFTGGAHGNTNFATLTFDTTTGQQYKFDDLWQEEHNPLDMLQPLVRENLKKQMVERGVPENELDEEWLVDGTSKPEDFQNFVVTHDSIIFYFAPYSVAAYAFGTFEVEVPLADVNVILKPPFLELSN